MNKLYKNTTKYATTLLISGLMLCGCSQNSQNKAYNFSDNCDVIAEVKKNHREIYEKKLEELMEEISNLGFETKKSFAKGIENFDYTLSESRRTLRLYEETKKRIREANKLYEKLEQKIQIGFSEDKLKLYQDHKQIHKGVDFYRKRTKLEERLESEGIYVNVEKTISGKEKKIIITPALLSCMFILGLNQYRSTNKKRKKS